MLLLPDWVKSDRRQKGASERHLHLGGAVRARTLWKMMIDRGLRTPQPEVGDPLREFIRSVTIGIREEGKRSLDSYLSVYDLCEYIQSGTHAVAESISDAVIETRANAGVLRGANDDEVGSLFNPVFEIAELEIRGNLSKRAGHGFMADASYCYDLDRIGNSALNALSQIELTYGGRMRLGFIAIFGRDQSMDVNLLHAKKIAKWRERYPDVLVGVDIAGSERHNPLDSREQLEHISNCFDLAAGKPFEGDAIPRTIHCGETPHVTIETFCNTIEALQPKRVAHPITALRAYREQHDDRGLRALKDRGITVEFCRFSNRLSGAVVEDETFKWYLDICDDFEIPYFFGTDAWARHRKNLAEELEEMAQAGILDADRLERSFVAGDNASFIRSRT